MPINPMPEPTPAQKVVQAATNASRTFLTTSWIGYVLSSLVGGAIAIAAGKLL